MTDIKHPEPGEDGRIPADELSAYLTAIYEAEYEEGRAARDALDAKKKKAVEELISLGVSQESAYFIVGYKTETQEKPKSSKK